MAASNKVTLQDSTDDSNKNIENSINLNKRNDNNVDLSKTYENIVSV